MIFQVISHIQVKINSVIVDERNWLNLWGIYEHLMPSDFIKLQSVRSFDNQMVEV